MLLNGVPIKIKLTQSSNDFRLISPTTGFKLVLDEVKLSVCYVDVQPNIYSQIINKLSKDTAKYHYMRSEIYSHVVQKGDNKVLLYNIFQDRIPSQLVIALVPEANYTGNMQHNPFVFKHYNLCYLDVNVNGKSLPYGEPLQPEFKEDTGSGENLEIHSNFSKAYLSLFAGTGKYGRDSSNFIGRNDYKKGYAIYCFNIDPAFERESQQPITTRGNLKIEIRFKEALTENATLLIYGNFPQTIEVDQARNVFAL
jgi:hypothetical protein